MNLNDILCAISEVFIIIFIILLIVLIGSNYQTVLNELLVELLFMISNRNELQVLTLESVLKFLFMFWHQNPWLFIFSLLMVQTWRPEHH